MRTFVTDKFFLKSKTMWGVLTVAAVLVAHAGTFFLSEEQISNAQQIAELVIAGLGTLLAAYGRAVAVEGVTLDPTQ